MTARTGGGNFGNSLFSFVNSVENRRLIEVLQQENPAIIAAVLNNMDRVKAAKLISDLPVELRSKVANSMGKARGMSPEVLADVAEGLREKIYANQALPKKAGPGMVQYGGPEIAAAILRYAPAEVRHNIKNEEPELFANLKRLMFTFDDFIHTPDRSLQIVFAEVDTKTLSLALKVALPQLKNRILRNMSDRRAAIVEDEIEQLAQVRMRDIEEARQNIIDHATTLQKSGKVILDQNAEAV